MVKLFAFLYRREGMTHDEFIDHWRHRHGPLIARSASLSSHIVRYVQHPRLHQGPLSGTTGCDGVTEQWFASIDDFAGFIADPDYAALIAPDEQRFLDMSKVTFVCCDEPWLVIGGDPDAT